MKFLKGLLVIVVTSVFLLGCEQHTSPKDKVKDGMEEVKDGVKESAEATKEKVIDAAKDIKEDSEETTKDIKKDLN